MATRVEEDRTIQTGPSCSKLTMSLVNVSLKLWSLNMADMLIFLLKKKKCDIHVQKLLTRTVNILTTNELVKITMLWTTGPRLIKIRAVAGQSSSLNFALGLKVLSHFSKSATLTSRTLMWLGMVQHRASDQNLTSGQVSEVEEI